MNKPHCPSRVILFLFALRLLMGSEAISENPKEISNSIGIKLVLVPAGSFVMGATSNNANLRQVAAPQHEVQLTNHFYLGVFEVTNEQYKKVMGQEHYFSPEAGPQHPVTSMDWNSAVYFCDRLSGLPAEKTAGRRYRLPTEAEWEYACRAGSKSAYCFDESANKLDDYAWYLNNTSTDGKRPSEKPVGTKKPNAWGLFDMHGNVDEFCQDTMGNYASTPVVDPVGKGSTFQRVIRGGNFHEKADYCRSSARNSTSTGTYATGFRLAMSFVGQTIPPKQVVAIPLAKFDHSVLLERKPRNGPIRPLAEMDFVMLTSYYDSIEALLANGVDPDTRNKDGFPILFYAIQNANVQAKNDGAVFAFENKERQQKSMPLLQRPAISKGLVALLEAGADPNIRDPSKLSPLHIAVANNNPEVAQLLYDYGADPSLTNASGKTVIEFGRTIKNGIPLSLFEKPRNPQIANRIKPPRVVRFPNAQLGDQRLGNAPFRLAREARTITYSADGKRIIVGENSHVLRVFDATTGECQSVIDIHGKYGKYHRIESLTTIPNSSIVLVSCGMLAPLQFWNIDTGEQGLQLSGENLHASVAPNGKYLYTSEYLCEIESINPLKLAPSAREFLGTHGQKTQVLFSFFTEDSRLLVFLSGERLRMWNLETDEVEFIEKQNRAKLGKMSPKYLAKIGAQKQVNDLKEVGSLLKDLQNEGPHRLLLDELTKSGAHRVFAFSPNMEDLAATGVSHRIDRFDVKGQIQKTQFSGHNDSVLAVVASSDDQWITSVGLDLQMILWERSTGKAVRNVPLKSTGEGASKAQLVDLASAAMKPWQADRKLPGFDEKRGALVAVSNTLKMLEAKSTDGNTYPLASGAIAVSSDGKLAAAASQWGGIRLFDLKKQETINKKFVGAIGSVNDIEFSFDGNLIAAGCDDGTVRVWDVASANQLIVFDADAGPIVDIAFESNGNLVTANSDGTVNVWNTIRNGIDP